MAAAKRSLGGAWTAAADCPTSTQHLQGLLTRGCCCCCCTTTHCCCCTTTQAVANHLGREDLLVARLVCRQWASDLSAFVTVATAIPSQLLRAQTARATAGGEAAQPGEQQQQEAAASPEQAIACREAAEAVAAAASRAAAQASADAAVAAAAAGEGGSVRELLAAFPHVQALHCDVGAVQEQLLAHIVLGQLAGACGASSGSGDDAAAAAGDAAASDAAAGGSDAAAGAVARRPGQRVEVCLDALQRSYHCHSRQDHPASPASAGASVFLFLGRLPRQLSSHALAAVTRLQLDAFPQDGADWLLLRGLPCLRALVLPSFRPALPHEQLLQLAQLSQLQELTLSVQVGECCSSSGMRARALQQHLPRMCDTCAAASAHALALPAHLLALATHRGASQPGAPTARRLAACQP